MKSFCEPNWPQFLSNAGERSSDSASARSGVAPLAGVAPQAVEIRKSAGHAHKQDSEVNQFIPNIGQVGRAVEPVSLFKVNPLLLRKVQENLKKAMTSLQCAVKPCRTALMSALMWSPSA